MKHCFAKAPQYEASPFHSDMKHFAYAPYDVRKWKMRVYPFAIQRYPHYIMTCNPVLYDWIFLYLDFTQRTTGIYSKSSPRQRTNRERQILGFEYILNKLPSFGGNWEQYYEIRMEWKE